MKCVAREFAANQEVCSLGAKSAITPSWPTRNGNSEPRILRTPASAVVISEAKADEKKMKKKKKNHNGQSHNALCAIDGLYNIIIISCLYYKDEMTIRLKGASDESSSTGHRTNNSPMKPLPPPAWHVALFGHSPSALHFRRANSH